MNRKRWEYVPDGANLFDLMNVEKEDEDAQKVLTTTACNMNQRQNGFLSSQRALKECIDEVGDRRVQIMQDHHSDVTRSER